MLVGEQPGDRENRVGEPFVGPAGRVLAQALEKAGIPLRGRVPYQRREALTKDARRKRRIHRKPGTERLTKDPGTSLASALAPVVVATLIPRRYCGRLTTNAMNRWTGSCQTWRPRSG